MGNEKVASKEITILVFVFYSLLWGSIIFFSGTATSGIHFQDDHEMIMIYSSLSEFGFIETLTNVLNREIHEIGRFRPVFYLIRVLEIYVIGPNFLLLYIFHAFITVTSCFLLFQIGSRLGMWWPIALGFPLFFFLGPQAEIVWMLGTSEPFGVLFLALSVLDASNSQTSSTLKSFRFLFFACLAGLCKESFFLMIPAILVFQIFFRYLASNSILKSFRSCSPHILLGFFLLAAFVSFFQFYIGSTSINYAGYERETPLTSYYAAFHKLFFQDSLVWGLISLFATLLATGILSFLRNQFSLETAIHVLDRLLFTMICFLVIVIPQILLYGKSGIDGRYFVPASLAPALLFCVPASLLTLGKLKIPRLVCLVICIATLQPRMSKTNQKALFFSDTGKQSNGIFKALERHASRDSVKNILFVIDPTEISSFEICGSSEILIRSYLGLNDTLFYVFLVPNTKEISDLETLFQDNLVRMAKGRIFETLNEENVIGQVIIFPPLEQEFLIRHSDWLTKNNMIREEGHNFVHYHARN